MGIRPDQPVLVGRGRERQLLGALLDRACAGQGCLVLVSGEAGIGKTTLVEDVLRAAHDRGCLILSGACYDLTTTPPFGPWIEAMRGYQPAEGLPSFPSWFGNLDEVEKLGSQTAIFEETRRFFAAIAGRQPLAIALEDLHWADPATVDALRYLARTLADEPVLIIATYRDDEPRSDHPLFAAIPALVRETRAERLELKRWLEADTRALVASRYRLTAEDEDRLSSSTHRLAEGNPFYTVELLRMLEGDETLRPQAGGWKLDELTDLRIPPLVRQVIERRLNGLSEETRMLLEVAAVIGQEVPYDLWQTVTGLREPQFDQVIAAALETRLLEEPRGAAVLRFRHALLREALYKSLLVSRRRFLHRQVGDTLTRLPRADPDIVAYHFQQAGDPRAIEWLIRAGRRAERRYALIMAAAHYEAAQALLEGDTTQIQTRGWLLLYSAWLLRWSYPEFGLAYAHMKESGRLAAEVGDQVLSAYSMFLCGWFHSNAAEGRLQGLAEMEAGAAAIDALSPADRARTETPLAQVVPDAFPTNAAILSASAIPMPGRLSGANYFKQWLIAALATRGRFNQAVDLGEQHIAQVSAVISDEALVQATCVYAYVGLGEAYTALGQSDKARHWLTLAGAAVAALGDHALLAYILLQEMNLLITYRTEQVAERRDLATQATQAGRHALDANATERTSTPSYHTSVVWLEDRWDEAREVLSASRKWIWTWGLLGKLAHAQGKPAEAWAMVHQTLPCGLETEPAESHFYFAMDVQRLAVALALDAGDRPNARQWLEMHDRWLEWSGTVPGRAESQLLWARYHREAGDLRRARYHVKQALGEASNPRQPLALIATRRFLGEIDTQERDYEVAGAHLTVAAELAEACQAPYEIALTQLAQAELARATRDVPRATELLTRARDTFERLGAKPALEHVDRFATGISGLSGLSRRYPAGLTPREVEVLCLVADGLSNRDIAGRLYLSVRTVERHVTNIYAKIQVTNRVEAATFVREQQLTVPPSV